MMALDTHVVAWLHAGETERFPGDLLRRLDAGELIISPVVLLELEYLHEIGRLSVNAERIFADLAREIGLCVCSHPFLGLITEALRQPWTRDPFDRMIVAHAISAGHQLVTKDKKTSRTLPLPYGINFPFWNRSSGDNVVADRSALC